MNASKLILSLSCFVAVTLASPIVTAAPRGGGHGGHGGMSARSGHSFSRGGMGRAGGQRWSGRNWSGRNWSGRNWNGNWRHHHGHNKVIFIGGFGFPSWWGWGYPYYGYGYGYPYGYYGYGYPYGYGYGYGDYGYSNGYEYGYGSGGQYGSATRSRVAELQRRLARAGYYRGSVDGILGPQTRRAIRAYEQDHGYADAG
jgi:hypothetical protein